MTVKSGDQSARAILRRSCRGADQPTARVTARRPTRQAEPAGRGLLVLDGDTLTPEVQRAAEACCERLVDRIDILLVNPPEAPVSRLHEMLFKLERAGIDYRLTCTRGRLVEQVAHYLKRFLGIRTVIVDSRLPGFDAELASLKRDGCRFVSLAGSPMAN